MSGAATGRYRTQKYCAECHNDTVHKLTRDNLWICTNCGHCNDQEDIV